MRKRYNIINNILIIIFLYGISQFAASCSGENCLQSAGPSETLSYKLDSINTIEFSDVFDVVLVPDTLEEIQITCGQNLQDGIIFSYEGFKLGIGNANSCNFLRSYDNIPLVTIHSKKISSILVPGNINFSMPDTLTCDSFLFAANGGINTIDLKINTRKLSFSMNGGTGDYRVTGHAGLLYLYFFGTGFFWGENLQTDILYGQQRSTGDIHLRVTHELNLKLFSSGDAYYYEEPGRINFSAEGGSGQLIPSIAN